MSYDQLHSRSGPTSTGGGSTGRTSQVEWYETGGSATYSAANEYAPYNPAAAPSGAEYGSFDDEPPLLEELGIDLGGILRRTRGVLIGRLRGPDMEELDVGGPLLFSAVLGASHLVWQGKVHFGVILGWSVLAAIVLWFVVRNIAGDSPDVRKCDLSSCYSCLGYALLPMVAFSLLSILLPKGYIAAGAGAVVSLWCASLASRLFVRRSPVLVHYRNLVAYPCLLAYSAFALLTLY